MAGQSKGDAVSALAARVVDRVDVGSDLVWELHGVAAYLTRAVVRVFDACHHEGDTVKGVGAGVEWVVTELDVQRV